ncbi:MAG: hypothetical protein Q8N39_11135 [Pelolinea sp.]|nr:hypothetical protein [Pelolinea sp.]
MYDFDNNSERNLLLITSSQSRSIQPLIASHYYKTYVIDLRDEDVRAISLGQMINDYQINDVIVFGQPWNTYFSESYLITP